MLREATAADVETIRRWRNHPVVRGVSIFTDYITPQRHAEWWASVSADPARRVLIFEYLGVPAGVVTFNDHDPQAGTAEWGFFLDVEGLRNRGHLLPAWMELEKAAVAYGFGRMGLRAMGGRTLARNTQVLTLHRRFGFREVPGRGYVTQIAGRAEQVLWTELTVEAWHDRQEPPTRAADMFSETVR